MQTYVFPTVIKVAAYILFYLSTALYMIFYLF